MSYIFLATAILFEVCGTVSHRYSDGFTRLLPSALVVVAYGCSFYFLSLAIRVIPVEIAYAIWCGVGIVLLVAIFSVVRQSLPDLAALVGIAMIIGGIAVINVLSKSSTH